MHGYYAISVIGDNIFNGKMGRTSASEVLCIMGDLDDVGTHSERLSLLLRALSNESSRIREGAILGLSRMGEPGSMAYLKIAQKNEPYEFLQHYIDQVMHGLERNERIKIVKCECGVWDIKVRVTSDGRFIDVIDVIRGYRRDWVSECYREKLVEEDDS